MSKPKNISVETFGKIITTQIIKFVKEIQLDQKEHPENWECKGEIFNNQWFGNWMENFSEAIEDSKDFNSHIIIEEN